MQKLAWRLPRSRADLSSSSVRYDTILDETERSNQSASNMYQHVALQSTKLAVMTLHRCQAKVFLNDGFKRDGTYVSSSVSATTTLQHLFTFRLRLLRASTSWPTAVRRNSTAHPCSTSTVRT